jgi:hypothetical protein
MVKFIETKISIYRLATILCFWYGFISCDVLEPDADIINPSTEISDTEVVVLANTTSFIDLNSRMATNVPARAAVSSQPRYGTITDLGQGIIQYVPAVGDSKGRDNFEITLYTLNNEIIKRDTLVIVIENDSTKLPCNIYPRADYVYNASRDSILIDVTANDIICGGAVHLSIFKPNDQFPPRFGEATVVGTDIKYTPSTSFNEQDIIIYKLTGVVDTTRSAYGVVYITADSGCRFTPNDDHFTFDRNALDSAIIVPAYDNDALCGAINQYQVNVKSSPLYGEAFPAAQGFTYKANASAVLPLNDHFIYEVCKDGVCKSAEVSIKIKNDSLVLCAIAAREDTFNITNNNNSTVAIDVLANDSICGELRNLMIVKAPGYGVAAVEDNKISYKRDATMQKNDELEYEICNDGGCSRTRVIIKRING